MGFSSEYVDCVLKENFEDAKRLFLSSLLSIHYAHLVMLAECGIVEKADARAIRNALDSISRGAVATARYDGTCEDLFSHVERLVVEACGGSVAGRLHTARSRNDVDMTMYRMRQREALLALSAAIEAARESLIGLAARHSGTVVAVHTHTQPAQPTTVGHYLLAVVEQLERDAERVRAAFASTNRSPMGACAITGTGFPIDRESTSNLLGFSAPTGNTYGSIATVDYLLESASAAAVMLVGLGRFTQDMLLWSTREFGYLRLSDGFVQSSSIMPQKRNPVALEHARALASKALAQALGIFLAVHNTPFGDIVDTEDDLQPMVFSMFGDAVRAVSLVGAAMSQAELDVRRLEARASEDWITLTELADTIARERQIAFRTAHEIAGSFMKQMQERSHEPAASVLADVSSGLPGGPVVLTAQRLEEILSPRHFIAVRRTPGGPAPEQVEEAMKMSRDALDRDRRWRQEESESLAAAERLLRERSRAL
jgi:argininosuccinate lyase